MYYLQIIVYKIPPGKGGVYSQRKAWPVWYGATMFNI